VVRAVFGAGRDVTDVERLAGGSKKGAYRGWVLITVADLLASLTSLVVRPGPAPPEPVLLRCDTSAGME
jgi:hypothetical protein